MAKKKSSVPAIDSKEKLHSTIDEIARLEVTKRQLEAARDAAVQTVRKEHDGKIEETIASMKALAKLAEIYGKAERESIFGKLKSAFTALARFGFREGTPALCLLNKKTTWDKVKETLKEKGRTEFVRTAEEVDKEAIKNAKLTDAELAGFGLRIDSKETFFIEPKGDEATRVVAESEAAA